MCHFQEQILSKRKLIGHFSSHWRGIVVEKILGYTGSLNLPVKPYSPGAVVNMVSADNHINRGMHFDSANFITG